MYEQKFYLHACEAFVSKHTIYEVNYKIKIYSGYLKVISNK